MGGQGSILCNAKTAPAFAFCGLQSLEHVEEGDGRRGISLWCSSGDGRDDLCDIPCWLCLCGFEDSCRFFWSAHKRRESSYKGGGTKEIAHVVARLTGIAADFVRAHIEPRREATEVR